jgi:TRAP-type C4-dicarboxylate transport system permease small subunit
MSKRQWLIIFGVIVAILPFLGFPSSWIAVLSVIIGILIVFIAYRIQPNSISKNSKEAMPFSEHKSEPEKVMNDINSNSSPLV